MFNLSNLWMRARVEVGSALALLLLLGLAFDTSWAQLGHGTLEPIRFTRSDDQRLVSSRVEIRALPEIETADRVGPAWYSGPVTVSISVYSFGSARPGYALVVHRADEAPVGSSQAIIPVSAEEKIVNESSLEGCASPTGEAGGRWLTTPGSDQIIVELPSSRVQALRFC